MKTKVAGVWKDSKPSMRVSGAWKPCTKGSVNVSGVWREFYAQERVSATYIFSANSLNPNPVMNTVFGYVAGKTDLTIIVNPGVYIYSNSSTPALRITGGAVGDTVTLINNGFIMGRGGDGTKFTTAMINATVGQPAISTTVPMTIDTLNGYIGGGGGGGGGGAGGGGGGGAGGGLGGGYSGYSTGGTSGGLGGNGTNGTSLSTGWFGGGGGGRIMPGVGGAARSVTSNASGYPGLGGGAGGGGEITISCGGINPGAGGGGWGAAGGNVLNYYYPEAGAAFAVASGKGGDAGAAGNNESSSFSSGPTANYIPGAAGGKAIVTNGHAITYVGASASRVYGIVG